MIPRVFWHYLGAFGLTIQALGATIWWFVLWVDPRFRAFFRPSPASDATLLSFFLPDLVFFIGAGLWAARNLLKKPRSALLPLALHTGAATYMALFCLMQWISTGEALVSALLMAPSLVFGPFLLWKLSPRD